MIERGISQHRIDVTSAMYYLVWHEGMSIDHAEAFIAKSRDLIKPLAKIGRVEGKRCFKTLYRIADDAFQDERRRRFWSGKVKP